MDTFLTKVDPFLKTIPDFGSEGLSEKIQSKCKVLHFPVNFKGLLSETVAESQCVLASETSPAISSSTESNLCIESETQNESVHTSGDELTSQRYDKITTNNSIDCLSASIQEISCHDCDDDKFSQPSSEGTAINKLPEVVPGSDQRKISGEIHDHVTKVGASSENPAKPLHIVWPHRW